MSENRIGTRLREARVAENLTTGQLAAETSVGASTIEKIETGRSVPRRATWDKLLGRLPALKSVRIRRRGDGSRRARSRAEVETSATVVASRAEPLSVVSGSRRVVVDRDGDMVRVEVREHRADGSWTSIGFGARSCVVRVRGDELVAEPSGA
jgi:DNA-binding XRE family transcriptional regulator